MGDYFREEEKRKDAPPEKLIEDFDELCTAYDILVNKVNETTSQSYEAILPIKVELTGSGRTADDIGQIGYLRREIERSRIYRMPMGIMMYNALKNIEDLEKWSDRYSKYLEDYVDGMKLICRSGFKMIAGLHMQINELNRRIRHMEGQMLMQRDMVAPPQRVQEMAQPALKDKKIPPILKKIEQDEGHIPKGYEEEISMGPEYEEQPSPMGGLQFPTENLQEIEIKTKKEDGHPLVDVKKGLQEKFQRDLKLRIRNYRDALKSKDEKMIKLARDAMLYLAYDDKNKLDVVSNELKRAEKEAKTVVPTELFKPISPKNA